jgi:ankyrin repeat protein
MEPEPHILDSWIIPRREKRPAQPLPYPNETIKNFYSSIENFDNFKCKKIMTQYPSIVNVYHDYKMTTYNDGSSQAFTQITPLYLAAFTKNSKAVELLLAAGAQADKGTSTGSTPLHVAGNKRVARLLVEKDKTLVERKDSEGNTPLRTALNEFFIDRLDVAHYVIKHGADVNERGFKGNTPLHDAIKEVGNNKKKMTKIIFLFERGASILLCNDHFETPMGLIDSDHDNFRLKKLIRPVKRDSTHVFNLFASIIAHDTMDNFQKLLTLFVDEEPNFEGADKYGNTLMHKAMIWGRPSAITFLVSHNHLPITSNVWGQSVVDMVYASEDQACIASLNKAVFDAFFSIPCYRPGYQKLKSFLKYAFLSKHKDIFLRGIVHAAASYPMAEVAYDQCARLLKWGAQIDIQSCPGDFPLHDDKYPYALSWAVKKGDADLIHLFLEHGAKVHQEMLEDDFKHHFNHSELQEIRYLLEKTFQEQKEDAQHAFEIF